VSLLIHTVVGSRIKYLRETNNYTREAFAEMVGISSKFLYEIETGKKGFSIDTLYNISQILGVSCDYILTGYTHYPKCDPRIVNVIESFDAKQQERVKDILQLIYNLSL
jgi:transcriptional regulator with XRE-family HTH domain